MTNKGIDVGALTYIDCVSLTASRTVTGIQLQKYDTAGIDSGTVNPMVLMRANENEIITLEVLYR